MLSIIAKMPIKEGKMDEAVQAIKELISQVATESGTLLYTLNRDKKNPNLLVFMERYKDQAALDAHGSSPYFKAFFGKSAAFLSGRPEISVLEEIASI